MTHQRLFRIFLVTIALLAALAAVGSAAAVGARQERVSADPGQTPLFGPKQYTRVAGPPQIFTETFQRCGTAPAQIVVVNGNPDGSNRISSASIVLNGGEVVGPSDFNQQVARIVKPVTLGDDNQLTIRLTSRPGGFITITVETVASGADLTAHAPGVSVPNPNALSSAVVIANEGTVAAANVQVTSIALTGGVLATAVPVGLGTIAPEASAVLHADFTGGPFLPGSAHVETIGGTYVVDGAIYCFELEVTLVVPPAGPGDAPLRVAMIPPLQISGAPFPALPPEFDDDESNPSGWTVPNGPFVPGIPTPGMTGSVLAPLKARPEGQGGSEIIFTGNRGVGITNGSTTAEPSGGSTAGGVVFVTSNWWAAYSTNNGATFTRLDPTTIFPADAVGFCCDQVVQYVPSIDRFIWFLQGNGYRLAMASPQAIINSGGTAWTYWNLTPQVFGQPAGTGFDYPDLAVGDNSLYMSWDAGAGCPAGCTSGFQVVRTSLAGLQAAGTITVEFTDPANGGMCWGSHICQDTGNEIFWAGHNSNSQMRLFSLAEGSNTYFWRDRNVSSWANNAPTSLTPDGQDWLAKNFNGPGGNSFPFNGVIGATRSGNQVWFAWTAGTNGSFQQAHVEMVTFDRGNNFSKTQQVQIWNNSYAFAYPCLATNVCTGEIGLSLEYGGNGNYENHVVGFWGDFVVYITSSSNVGTKRFGDYVTLRQKQGNSDNPGNLFDAFGYGLNSVPPPGTGTRTDVRYVSFGRPSSTCNIIPFTNAPATRIGGPRVATSGGEKALDGRIAVTREAGSGHLRVAFAQKSEGPVELHVYDIRGRLVKSLSGTYPAGVSAIDWNGLDAQGRPAAAGIYLFRLDAGGATYSAKEVWMR